jgi:hypothetical protein
MLPIDTVIVCSFVDSMRKKPLRLIAAGGRIGVQTLLRIVEQIVLLISLKHDRQMVI